LEGLADTSKVPLDVFLDDTVRALSGTSTDESSYAYSARSSDAGLELTWKKVSKGIKFQLGNIGLVPAEDRATHCFLLNHSLDCTLNLKQKIRSLEEECRRLRSERQTALDDLQASSMELDTIESELHGKFKLVLNEKKAKIRKLMESKSYLADQNEMQRQIWETKRSPAIIC
jgi:hypothetical protein